MRFCFFALFALFGMASKAYSIELPTSAKPYRPVIEICRVDFTAPQLYAFRSAVSYDPGTEFNTATGNSWKMTGYGSSYIQVNFQTMIGPNLTYKLCLNAASRQDAPNLAKISISVNGQMAVTGFQVTHSDFSLDSFDISKYIQKGPNEMVISLDLDTQSSLAIQNIFLNLQI